MKTLAAAASMLALFGWSCGQAADNHVPVSSSVATESALHSAPPHADHITVVIMENRDYRLVIGSTQAPYLNGTLVPAAALMTNSHGVTHPSQPNYIDFFSGSDQGVTDDSCPHSFATNNLGNELRAAKKTFDGYSESMPQQGFTGCTSRDGLYARKHNPWVNFADLPPGVNQVFHDIPSAMTTVAIVVPNLCNDMHDCSTRTGDNWLKANLPSIIAYDRTTKGLLIVTWDEADPDNDGTNHIATLLIGPMVVPGKYGQSINHFNVLRTMQTIAGVKCLAQSCSTPAIKGIWR